MLQNNQPINPEIERLIADAKNLVSKANRQLETQDEIMRSLGVDPQAFSREQEEYLRQNPVKKAEAEQRLQEIGVTVRRQADAGHTPSTPRAPKRRMMV